MRNEVIEFSRIMDDIITYNTIEKGKGEWENYDFNFFIEKLVEEYAEVICSFRDYNRGKIKIDMVKSELVDLANICMMLHTKLNNKGEINEKENTNKH